MAVDDVDIRINGASLQYPEIEIEERDEVVLDNTLDADLING